MALDLALGDPRWLPHPVRGIGWLASRLESLAGGLIGEGSGRAGWSADCRLCRRRPGGLGHRFTRPARWTHPLAGDRWWPIAGHLHDDRGPRLARHGMAVCRALAAGNLAEARRRVAAIVGRDTERLDEPGVVRAAVESVAESTVDGVTAPLFFALVAGPVGAMVYRAINTLDSMFGHQDERYRRVRLGGRADGRPGQLPSRRLTAPLVCVAALLGSGRSRPCASCSATAENTPAPMPAGRGRHGRRAGRPTGRTKLLRRPPLDRPPLGDPSCRLAAAHPAGQRPDVAPPPDCSWPPAVACGWANQLGAVEGGRMKQSPSAPGC